MKSILTTTVALLALSAPAFAETDLDANGDGNVTLPELQAAYPEMTADDFAGMDTDEDGVLSDSEITAATDAGLLPA